MNNKKVFLFLFLILITAMIGVLNIKVTTKQGVNYHVYELEIPIYLKVLNFYDRHFNYKWLVNRITKNLETKEEKVIQIFKWTHENIRPQPKSLPIMDDHVWNVYLRGYGINENFNDLFTTLCSYVGLDSVFISLKSNDSSPSIQVSFIKLGKGWVLLDPYHGGYIINKDGGLATIEDINGENWRLQKIGSAEISDSFYGPYLENLPDIGDVGLNRANTQSPVNRLLFFVRKNIF
jgi:hypothetical protein